MSPQKRRGYRERVYASYVSCFKGEASDLAAQAQGRFFDHLFGPVLGSARPERVLEVGCGAGLFLRWAIERGIPSVEGFDLSPEQVTVARSLDLPAVHASFQDFFSRCPRRFDLIVALDVLEHLDRDEGLQLLDSCFEALAPGGRLLLTTPNASGLRPGPVMYGDLTHEFFYSPDTARLALRLAGFIEVKVREVAPPVKGVVSFARRVLWTLIRLGAMAVDVIETGRPRTDAYSRVMLVEATRPAA